DLLTAAWPQEGRDEHAVEMTVARLRTALGPAAGVVQTVVKRGYRLAAADEIVLSRAAGSAVQSS
ncbi:winged helix-turn-helix domain-containing protein, partial [Pseudomonas aeruginosa]|uniref:winged helix-turn-helix domain-containing protein n=1 Tax=Pseudomonas aeruginosa TaxID=287 RepID=UPI002F917DFE